MEKFELQRLRDLSIEGVAERMGMEVTRHKALCPFHDDHHPSLSFNLRKNTYRCFVCDAHGGTIDLVMHLLHKDFKEACSWLSNGTYEPPKTIISNLLSINSNPPFDPSKYQRFFDHPYLSPATTSFLFSQRHLDPRVIHWCRLTSWRDRQGIDWLQIPYFDQEGKLVGVQNRNLNYQSQDEGNLSSSPELGEVAAQRADGGVCPAAESNLSPFTSHLSPSSAQPRFKFPRGSHCTIYNLPILNLLKQGEPLYIAEGCSDCWSLLSSGHKAIAIPSATLLNPKDLDTLLSINSKLSTQFHMFPDRDLPGERLFLQLRDLLPNLHRHDLPPTCKDFSDLYIQNHLTQPTHSAHSPHSTPLSVRRGVGGEAFSDSTPTQLRVNSVSTPYQLRPFNIYPKKN